MFSRHRLPLALAAAGACLLLAAGAPAAEGDTYTATSSPTHVQGSALATYTLTLTNTSTNTAPSSQADHATITAPEGFEVEDVEEDAPTTASGECAASDWQTGVSGGDRTITLSDPGGSGNRRLCPGGTLTVVFTATASATDGTFAWELSLSRGDEEEDPPFELSGAAPTVTVDATEPTVTISQKPSNPTKSTSASFAFTVDEPAASTCKLDNAAAAACTSSAAYTNLADGEHTFTVSATDAVGNTGNASYTWRVDATAPVVTISQKPPNPSNSRSATFVFAVNEAAAITCKLDGAAAASCTSPAAYTNLADGEHTFTIRATDSAGNSSEASHVWMVDATAPVITISQTPPTLSNSRSASFAFTVDEPATTVCKLDNQAAVACTSSATYNGLADGEHTFTVTATNATGESGVATFIWTIDATPPVATIVQKPLDPSNSTTASFGFIVTGSTSVACKLDDGAFSSCASPVSYTNLADGPHTFTVRGTDGAGNTGEASYSWSTETRAPTAAIASGPAALSNIRSATFTFTADEPASFACQLDGGSFQPCVSPASYDGLGDGPHTFSVRPTDAVGNSGAAPSHSWTIDATAPETTLGSAPRSGTTTLSATFTFSASEPGSFECKLDAASFAPCTSPRSYTGLRRGAHSFEVRAIDAAGNVDLAAALHRWTIAAPRRAQVTSALLAPRAGARITSPPLLAWRRVARATYYNVQLFRGSVKVLSAWPVRTRLQLRSRWTYLGRQRRLSPGKYRWYVWPAFGRRYGRLLGQSTFTVARPLAATR